jgi:GNAT superfamily N-acetyltransferase
MRDLLDMTAADSTTADIATAAPVQVRRYAGSEVLPYLDAVAALRIAVFRDWPYLYDGDTAYEREYLAAYAASPDSVFVLATAGDAVIGASTGLPLADDSAEFRAPFDAAGLDATRVFYFGESVLLPQWRGRGLGHAFFDHREAHARALGRFDTTAFCAVDRTPDDPRRPPGHRDNDPFWIKRGYVRQPQLRMHLHWRERDAGDSMPGEAVLGEAVLGEAVIGEAVIGEAAHTLTFWTRTLEPQA